MAGFTLIEALVALVVLSTVLLSFTWLFRFETKLHQGYRQDDQIMWHLFLTQLTRYETQWQFIEAQGNQQLRFRTTTDATNFYLEISRTGKYTLIKLRKLGGYEPLLMNLRGGQFAVEADYISLKVVMNSGKEYEAHFYGWR